MSAQSALKDATSSIKEAASDAQSAAQQTAGSIATAVKDGAKVGSDMTKQQVEKLETMIRANPMAAVNERMTCVSDTPASAARSLMLSGPALQS